MGLALHQHGHSHGGGHGHSHGGSNPILNNKVLELKIFICVYNNNKKNSHSD